MAPNARKHSHQMRRGHLVEVDGFVAVQDDEIGRLAGLLHQALQEWMCLGAKILAFVVRLRKRQRTRTQGIATIAAVLSNIAARQQGGKETVDRAGVKGNAVAEVKNAYAILSNGEGFQNIQTAFNGLHFAAVARTLIFGEHPALPRCEMSFYHMKIYPIALGKSNSQDSVFFARARTRRETGIAKAAELPVL